MSQLSQGQTTPNKTPQKTPPRSNPVLIPVTTNNFVKSPVSQVKSPVGANASPMLIPPRTVVSGLPPKLTPMTITQVVCHQKIVCCQRNTSCLKIPLLVILY